MRRIGLAVAATVTLTAPAHALKLAVPRISREDARYAVHAVFDAYAGSAGQPLVISPCEPAGRLSRACIARIGHERFRVLSRYANAELEPVVWHHRLRSR